MSLTASPPPTAGGAAAIRHAAGRTSRPLKRTARFLGDGGSDSDDGPARNGKKPVYDSDVSDEGVTVASRPGQVSHKSASSKSKVSKSKPASSRSTSTAQDIDRLFADLDDESDSDLALPAPLSTAAAKAQDEKGRNINDLLTVDGGDTGAVADKIDVDGKAKKVVRKAAIVNEERLLGDRGLRKLRDSLRGFKVKGKGHEDDDLRRLINVYQLWAHQMLPRWAFSDVLERTEVVCRKNGMKPLLRQWRDEASGKAPPEQIDGDEEAARSGNADGPAPSSSRANSPAPSSVTASAAKQPKKSYFDDIPTSSPGTGLFRRDEELESDAEDHRYARRAGSGNGLAGDDDVFFGSAPAETAQNQKQTRQTTSEAGFNDDDIAGFDFDEEEMFEEEDFDAMAREAELAMMEMERDAAEATSKDKKAQAIHSQKVAVAPPLGQQEDNMDDFDFGEEDEVMREMEKAAQESENRVESKHQSKSFYASKTLQKQSYAAPASDVSEPPTDGHNNDSQEGVTVINTSNAENPSQQPVSVETTQSEEEEEDLYS